ncbi:MAG: hypothetical protein KDD83_11470, partial [Caldilineaceae bacterium]|nr:hypothetical protein [Caldilineaceae bacterium]
MREPTAPRRREARMGRGNRMVAYEQAHKRRRRRRLDGRRGRAILLSILALLVTGCATGPVRTPAADAPRELIVFAAASLTDAMTELEQIFEAANPG